MKPLNGAKIETNRYFLKPRKKKRLGPKTWSTWDKGNLGTNTTKSYLFGANFGGKQMKYSFPHRQKGI